MKKKNVICATIIIRHFKLLDHRKNERFELTFRYYSVPPTNYDFIVCWLHHDIYVFFFFFYLKVYKKNNLLQRLITKTKQD